MKQMVILMMILVQYLTKQRSLIHQKRLKLKSFTKPVFSKDAEKSLISGTAWSNTLTRHQFINELAVYYTADNLFHRLKNSKQYKVIVQAGWLAY
jgi:hypothetical protein